MMKRTSFLGFSYRKILVHFQGKSINIEFNITVIQIYAPTIKAKEAEVDQFSEDQDFL